MSKLHDFLVEHAKFPFPHLGELQSGDTTDISELEVALLESEWKAKQAVPDNALVQKLCHTLEKILGDTPLAVDAESYLLADFSPKLQVDERGHTDAMWSTNPSEAHSRSLLTRGFFSATRKCLAEYGEYSFAVDEENSVEGGSSRVSYAALVNSGGKALCETKSPSFMKKVGELLPLRGVELKWVRGQSLVPKILPKVALYLGLRQMEWLFLTCHNYWIVCRLVRHDSHPFLLYSPKISIEDSSVPFRTFLGAILSSIKGVSVDSSAFNPDMQVDTMIGEADKGVLPKNDIVHESELMVTSSSPKSPESSRVWIHLHTFSNNKLLLPRCARNGKPRLWLTHFIGSGSTGNVWQCCFDNSDEVFAVKVVEVLGRSDVNKLPRLYDEFKTYRFLEDAYESGQLADRISPRCYGAFGGDYIDVLVLDLCDNRLHEWDELNTSERTQIYKLVQDLHNIGIVHKDLEPRNILRVRGGGFRLIDFSESRKHVCKDRTFGDPHTPHPAQVQDQKCFELKTLRSLLWKPSSP